jgi:cyclase
MEQAENFVSEHFRLETVGRGLVAAIHQESGAAIANAGIIDLGDSTMVFDTFISPAAAKDLRQAAEILTGRPVSYVFNSHYHNDHIRGNQEFPDAQIISTSKTFDLIQTDGMEELAWDQANAPKQYQHYQTEFDSSQDQTQREQIRFWLDYYRVLAQSLEGLRICEPQLTFEDRLILSGSERTVELLSYGGGHTGSDGFLYIPDEGVLFLSDLLFVGCHPFLADGHPDNWIAILEKIKRLDAAVLVPGHGPVGSKEGLDLMIDYIQMTADAAKHAAEGMTPKLPPPFNAWQFDRFFQINLGFMARWQTQKG